MKKFIVITAAAAALGFVSSAYAADMPTKAAVYKAPPSVALYNWTGFYVGGQGGYAWGKSFQEQGGISTGNYDIKGWFGGGTLGYNLQFNSFLAGIETDFSGADIKGDLGPGTFGNGYGCNTGSCHTEVNWFGTVRGRLGFVVNQFLIYGTGGWAYGQAEARINGAAAFGFEGTSTLSGWTAGAGVEYAFATNWTVKAEYLHVDLGNFIFAQAGPGVGASPASSGAKFDLLRFGLNYRFSGMSF